MKSTYRYILIICIIIFIFCVPLLTNAQDMANYTAYPPFVTNAIEPNILLLLDQSGSMQYPAYIDCEFNSYNIKRADCGSSNSTTDPRSSYDTSFAYYGYFKNNKYYNYSSNKFIENESCSFIETDPEYRIGNNSGCISGNLLNWAAMSRIDLLRKAIIGGKSVSLQGNAHTLRGEGGWWSFSDYNLGCTFTLSGGSYPQLDHVLSISNSGFGTAGYLTVLANGSSIWGTSDEFRYVYQPISGDFDVKLKVVSPPTESEQTYAKAGLMARANTNSNSRHVKVMATYGAGLQFSDRLTDGGTTATFADYVTISYPVWVRLVRSGDTFTAYYSSDGTSWTQQGITTVSMTSNILIGMATSSYSSISLGTGKYDEFICSSCSNDDFNDGSFNTGIWTAVDINTYYEGNQTESENETCTIGTLANADIKVDVPENARRGVIQNLSDKDYDADWDADSPRFGLMVFAGDNREGEMRTGIAGSNMSSFLTALQNEPPYGETPTGEALYEAYDYFIQTDSHSYEANNAYIGGQGTTKDPMYESGSAVECRKNFVLIISDGEWNGTIEPVVPSREHYINDIRNDIDGVQNISTYSVMTFSKAGGGRNSLKQISMFGGFDDYDSNTWPYDRTGYPADSRAESLPASPCLPNSTDEKCQEWDKDNDGSPDNYYEATDGSKLEATIIEAISDILQHASAGTAVSVLATTGEGEGAVYQAYFFPQKIEGIETRTWLGYIHALFVDKYGNMREDSNINNTLDITSDMILEMEYSPELGTQVNKYVDSNGDGIKDSSTPSSTVPLENVNSLWKGGEYLWQADPSSRTILTTIDGYNTIDFTTANSLTLMPYLRAADNAESDNIINWIRGDDLDGITDTGHPNGYRERSITTDNVTNVWKLGDIIYSTPTVVGRPMENYDLLYEDISYTNFRSTHLKRRLVVYVGANDGMLHAFNAGCFDATNHKYYSDVDNNGNCVSGSHSLGEELWTFIPHGLLPHLKWLTNPDYTHVFYVDLKPKVADARIFTADSIHTDGWGTILVGGFRYGGKDISWTSAGINYSASPEYFALDITDPLNPRLLWTFSDPDLGLSTSYPAGVKIGNDGYVIFGSGATNYDTGSNLTSFQNGYIFALKISGGNNGVIDNWALNTNYWKIPTGNSNTFLSNPISVDVNIDSDVDVMYIGENYLQSNQWNALLRRITTSEGSQSNPSNWTLSTLGNINSIAGNKDVIKRITAAPSAAMDYRANLFVYFGTGQFLGTSDKNQTDTGAFYAIKDGCWKGSCTTSYTNLMDISGTTVRTDGSVSGVSGSCGSTASTWADLLTASYNCDGWSMFFNNLGENIDFTGNGLNHNGERIVTKPLVLGGLVMWATYIPGIDECSYQGESNVYAVYYETGTAYKDYVFKDQKEDASPSDVVARVKKLGTGMPSSLSAQITAGGTAKGFVQQSTGSILEIESITPISIKSGIIGWKSEQIE